MLFVDTEIVVTFSLSQTTQNGFLSKKDDRKCNIFQSITKPEEETPPGNTEMVYYSKNTLIFICFAEVKHFTVSLTLRSKWVTSQD